VGMVSKKPRNIVVVNYKDLPIYGWFNSPNFAIGPNGQMLRGHALGLINLTRNHWGDVSETKRSLHQIAYWHATSGWSFVQKVKVLISRPIFDCFNWAHL